MEKGKNKTKKEKGVTLIALIVTITILLILTGVATYTGIDTIRTSKFTKFTTELKIMQTKVNEWYEEYKDGNEEILTRGEEITNNSGIEDQANKVFTESASGIEDKEGYRYYSQDTIKELGVEGVDEAYFINIEKRRVVSYEGYEYDGETYYTIEQIPDGMYNVEYEVSSNKPTFELKCDNLTDGTSKLTVTDIKYEGNINKWYVKYKLKGQNEWQTSEDYSNIVKTPGMYIVKVGNGEIESEEKEIESVKANGPNLASGMEEITFKMPTQTVKGEVIEKGSISFDEMLWYDYGNKKWANVKLEDGSMFVWIPRFAYKINSTDNTIDVKFLEGTSDTYYDDEGNPQKALRVTSKDEVADTTSNYYVHPAFTNESSIDYANGGWDSELTGIWVAKFEAGYASGNNSATPVQSNITYTQNDAWVRKVESGTSGDSSGEARNWLDGIYGSKETKISYPTFQGITYSMNYININDAYNISIALTENGNPYGLNSLTDSHLMKNNEWGAVAYLGWSKYGADKTEMYVNNISLNSGGSKRTETAGKTGVESVYAVTGLTTAKTNEGEKEITAEDIGNINNRTGDNETNTVYAWDQETGQKASTTLNIYGVFDMSGGTWERTAGYVANENSNLKTYGRSLAYEGENLKTISTKHTTVYPHDTNSDNTGIEENDTNLNTAANANYLLNTKIYGDAIRETSTRGTGSYSWNSDYSYFCGLHYPFVLRGGAFFSGSNAGSFTFSRTDGISGYSAGFRSVLVAP